MYDGTICREEGDQGTWKRQWIVWQKDMSKRGVYIDKITINRDKNSRSVSNDLKDTRPTVLDPATLGLKEIRKIMLVNL